MLLVNCSILPRNSSQSIAHSLTQAKPQCRPLARVRLCRVTLTNLAIALHLTSCSFRRFKNSRNGLNGAKRLNDWNVWNGLIPDDEQSEAVERLERLELAAA